mmetsp:Transcript_7414/g.21574  ORF Transcript_7414/g.21574 Transcript_7414/m.21574 type:complete len:220 (+) Transcript_7414:75-734(+)
MNPSIHPSQWMVGRQQKKDEWKKWRNGQQFPPPPLGVASFVLLFQEAESKAFPVVPLFLPPVSFGHPLPRQDRTAVAGVESSAVDVAVDAVAVPVNGRYHHLSLFPGHAVVMLVQQHYRARVQRRQHEGKEPVCSVPLGAVQQRQCERSRRIIHSSQYGGRAFVAIAIAIPFLVSFQEIGSDVQEQARLSQHARPDLVGDADGKTIVILLAATTFGFAR